MRDALSLLDQVITFSQGHMSSEKVLEILGLADRGLTLELLQTLIRREPKRVLPLLEKFSAGGGESELLIHELLELIRATLLLKLSGDNPPDFLELPDSEIRFLSDLAQNLLEEDLHLLFDMALKGEQDILRSSDPRLVLEMVLLRMAVSPQMVDVKAWLRGGAALAASNANANRGTTGAGLSPNANAATSAVGNGSAPAGSSRSVNASAGRPVEARSPEGRTAEGRPQPNAPESSTNRSMPNMAPGRPAEARPTAKASATLSASEKWYELVQFTKSDEPLLGAKLENLLFLGEFKSDAGGKIRLQIPPKLSFLQEQLTDAPIKIQIDKRVETAWGKGYSADIEVAGAPRSAGPEAAASTGSLSVADQTKNRELQRQEDLLKQVSEHPKVKLAQSVFNGKIQIRKKGE
jgi:DNA polymerase-3 subunit gamma/tau